ncbi:ornithine decarboxylase [Plakobranchus ocellatus]|uniref:Ornithine decarboxylase n=1 Tax=Plakobranchus ocellatus TaxID=259542 RepID=A0AAV4A8T2_9GAST|nr:ornithine decarboxylase [Plakobranchus ocellatus]
MNWKISEIGRYGDQVEDSQQTKPQRKMAALKMSQHASKPIYIYPATVSPTAQLMKERLLLRIQSCKKYTAKFNLNQKFGCDLANSPRLLRTAMNMGLRVVGITFHVGSLPDDPAVYASTIEAANDVYTYGEELGFHMHILDIGGGFHGFDTTNMTFQKV